MSGPANEPDTQVVKTAPREKWSQLGHVIGYSLVLLSSVFIFSLVRRYWPQIAAHDWSSVNGGTLLSAGFFYSVSLLLTALVWPVVMRAIGKPLDTSAALRIGLATQIGKYVPGSVAHYFARAAIARRMAVSYGESGLSTTVEVTAAILAGAIVATFALKTVVAQPGLDWAVVGLILLAIVTLGVVSAHLIASHLSQRVQWHVWFTSTSLLILSFIAAGLSLHLLLAGVGGDAFKEPLAIVGIYALAWIVGFAVPGAPAGLGVREAILIVSLGNLVGAPMAIVATAAHRLLTIAIDCLAALTGLALLPRPVSEGQS